jgi:hypothetical protein
VFGAFFFEGGGAMTRRDSRRPHPTVSSMLLHMAGVRLGPDHSLLWLAGWLPVKRPRLGVILPWAHLHCRPSSCVTTALCVCPVFLVTVSALHAGVSVTIVLVDYLTAHPYPKAGKCCTLYPKALQFLFCSPIDTSRHSKHDGCVQPVIPTPFGYCLFAVCAGVSGIRP